MQFTSQELVYLAHGMRVVALAQDKLAAESHGPTRDCAEHAAKTYRELEKKCQQLAQLAI